MKYSRLIVGVIILSSLLLFMGTKEDACISWCEDLALGAKWGWVEVYNDTLFHIGVAFVYNKGGDKYVLKHDPGMLRKSFGLGKIIISTFIIDPITRKWNFHRTYSANINDPGDTAVIRVTGGSLF